MWSALENAALRESLPTPLSASSSVHDILIAGQIRQTRHHLHYLGRRRSLPYLLRQYYSIAPDAFLRWQNEARFISLPPTTGYNWPTEEWRGGLIMPFQQGTLLDTWLNNTDHPLQQRLEVATRLADRIAVLHASGIAHRGLSPSNIHIAEHDVTIMNFGYSYCDQWDDFWSDSIMQSDDHTCSSPEFLMGENCLYAEDTHAFGVLIYLILSGNSPFSAIEHFLRPLFPSLIQPASLSNSIDAPPAVRELISACLAPSHADRPLMTEAASILSQASENPLPEEEKIVIPTQEQPSHPRKKVMVFIKADNRAIPLFDTVLQSASTEPAMFLFVGLLPGNLPSGHAERFRGNLFRKMGQGLLRCREKNVLWSLRVLEKSDHEAGAVDLINRYHPDAVFMGQTNLKKDIGNFQHMIKSGSTTELKIEIIH